MKTQLAKTWRNKFSLRFEGRVGIHALLFLLYLISVELVAAGLWCALTFAFVKFDKYLLMHGVISANFALAACIVITFGLGAIIFGSLLGTTWGKTIMLKIATMIDDHIIDQLFHQKLFFPTPSFIRFVETRKSFKNRTPALPEIPPRDHLA